ncbi:winged helix-turn-helix transcriptional regulator, partial [Candidatus Bathyarchaeota archaeon]|nr:winged helix-turn-helix transcriptional regulator [Candidatus Bathyarchaeota archaeon]
MGLNPVKKKILEEMALRAQPRRPKEIAEKVGVNFSSCMMHILGLKKAGFVSSPFKGYYGITNLGRDVVDNKTSEGEDKSILASF